MAFRQFMEQAEWRNDAFRYFLPLSTAFRHFPPFHLFQDPLILCTANCWYRTKVWDEICSCQLTVFHRTVLLANLRRSRSYTYRDEYRDSSPPVRRDRSPRTERDDLDFTEPRRDSLSNKIVETPPAKQDMICTILWWLYSIVGAWKGFVWWFDACLYGVLTAES